jgi:hypothetical protein
MIDRAPPATPDPAPPSCQPTPPTADCGGDCDHQSALIAVEVGGEAEGLSVTLDVLGTEIADVSFDLANLDPPLGDGGLPLVGDLLHCG